MIGLCQEGKSSPDALWRSAGVNSFGFFAACVGLTLYEKARRLAIDLQSKEI